MCAAGSEGCVCGGGGGSSSIGTLWALVMLGTRYVEMLGLIYIDMLGISYIEMLGST